MTEINIQLPDEEATLAFGKVLSQAVQHNGGGGMLYLHGDLGAGKTTLTRGVLRGFGFEGAVKSPTYTLVEPYQLDAQRIYHFDLYRLADSGEVGFLGVEEYFSPQNLCLIEWAERGGEEIPVPDLRIYLDITGTSRNARCLTETELGEAICQRLS